ncbi:MAG: tRNA 4-thiouridine(8) synthase ThiI [Nitrospirae bacterium CG18_big_fil_WC_8_21_14_2_50_70_55]|nr:tRNA 4-thiouridine(8) synthase ThiI [Deltaproteobacteria bacterium]OIP62524.1 MAG: tRNA 4-thiouridine(8) synthase ThiI [Nitrospirae bacterium CG2_30_70_394]PIQ07044.1 MAG: tRNA 4-thiouridine(8) synthase ThiI [Nitrospirae bacterium CG18_big_fil_WC_8_21_14_2_50_70_55]PIU78901.1 MAG: tRNA 4-thiouridine(8) synthase ThiI [Nitrospirae bacterium CG06_land_8_20_14_3_00_70_43]PIW82349.1 MAG: tRNA 4-thiouridine(8) synthase ThiI [Nitrospirae bacterium CG_4_8_14_3_um_filter_70_85]PIX84105.1 MAG: tRNA 4
MADLAPCLLVHYAEIGLKGRNRPLFERRLIGNIEHALARLATVRVRRLYGRIMVELEPGSEPAAMARLGRVFGIAYFAPALACAPEEGAIRSAALQVVAGHGAASFAVRAKRADKSFPLSSQGLNQTVGAAVQAATGWPVDLEAPALTLRIEVVDRRCFVYCDRIEGRRGLPVGVSGQVVALLSGGIDSPVAAARMMRRGCRVSFVHFHSFPYTNAASQEKVEGLVGLLGRYQGPGELHLVPLLEIQRHIVGHAPPALRVLLYRRAMIRLAAEIARDLRAPALVTGESLGQVASQTLSNLTAVDRCSPLPLLRPLLGWDKEEIIDEAKRLGTFDLSIAPHEDCCSFLEPKAPATRCTDHKLRAVERDLALEPLLAAALAQDQRRVVAPVEEAARGLAE